MQVHDLVIYAHDAKVRVWEIVGIHLESLRNQSMVRLMPLMTNPGWAEDNKEGILWVPIELLEGKVWRKAND